MARTGGPGAKGVSAFLVPTDTPGFSATKMHGKLGLRSCDTAELVLDDVVVGPTRCSARPRAPASRSRCRRWTTAACRSRRRARACARRRWRRWSTYTTQRMQFGKPIAAHQLVQELIADTAVEIDCARLLTWRVADLKQRGEHYALAASKAKLLRLRGQRPGGEQLRPGARRLRLHRRVPGRQAAARRPRHHPVRGHQPDPEADHRPGADRALRVLSGNVQASAMITPLQEVRLAGHPPIR